MKKSICLAIVGAAVLTGCQNEVMQQRGYVPAPGDDAEAVSTVAAAPGENTVSDRSSTEIADERGGAAAERPAARNDRQEFPTMSGSFGNEGISSDGGAPSARGGEYVVRPGDTLGKIAAAHNVKLSALMKANNMTNKDAKKLRVGRKLVIPSGSEAATGSGKGKGKAKGGKKGSFGGSEAATGKSARKPAKAEIQPGEYVIKSGDTPEKIARRAGVKLSALMEANKMTEEAARRLQVGQKIVIPGKGAATTTAKSEKKAETKTAPATPAAAPAQSASGSDNLENEMNDTAVGPQAAPAATPAAAPTAAPAPSAATPEAAPAPEVERTSYVQLKEDTGIEAFARQHGTTPEVIRQLNPDITGNQLTKDRIYEVPKK